MGVEDERETQQEGQEFMNLEEEARRHFNSGYNCAESVSIAVGKRIEWTTQGSASCIP
jgi:hypothetical protein